MSKDIFVNYPEIGQTHLLPCGGHAVVDPNSGTHSLICLDCLSVIGSMGMPLNCKEDFEKEKMWEKLQK